MYQLEIAYERIAYSSVSHRMCRAIRYVMDDTMVIVFVVDGQWIETHAREIRTMETGIMCVCFACGCPEIDTASSSRKPRFRIIHSLRILFAVGFLCVCVCIFSVIYFCH